MENQNQNYTVSTAIIIAGLIIAGAVLLKPAGTNDLKYDKNKKEGVQEQQVSIDIENVKEISQEDYILGNPNAPIKIIEFSDIECPFCKRFHVTMNRIVDEYGKDGKVAWVYRHFPLDQLHSNARKEAQATECAGEIGGNTAFWEYLNRIFEITPSNDGLDLAELPEIAEYVGIDKVKFNECLTSNRYADKIESQVQDAISSGAKGTPYSIVIAPNGKKLVINGAQPYEKVKAIIESLLNEEQ